MPSARCLLLLLFICDIYFRLESYSDAKVHVTPLNGSKFYSEL